MNANFIMFNALSTFFRPPFASPPFSEGFSASTGSIVFSAAADFFRPPFAFPDPSANLINFYIFIIKNGEYCVKNDEFCINNDELCH